jgi:hypothetical protein
MDDFDYLIILMFVCLLGSCLFSFLSFMLQLWLFIERKFYIKAMAMVTLEYLGIDLKELHRLYKQKKVSNYDLLLNIRKAKHTKVSNNDVLQAIRKSVLDAAKLINKDETKNR